MKELLKLDVPETGHDSCVLLGGVAECKGPAFQSSLLLSLFNSLDRPPCEQQKSRVPENFGETS